MKEFFPKAFLLLSIVIAFFILFISIEIHRYRIEGFKGGQGVYQINKNKFLEFFFFFD